VVGTEVRSASGRRWREDSSAVSCVWRSESSGSSGESGRRRWREEEVKGMVRRMDLLICSVRV
jgi:hypothetical protein